MSEIIEEIYPQNKLAVLSGPNFSSEVISGKPTACVISTRNDKRIQEEISGIFSKKIFRTYFNSDIVGTQVGGAMKNVIAIACGIIKGKKLGNNALAAIITRGLSEIVELGVKMGAKQETFFGLSGIGDLTLTCSSLKSRNTQLGYFLANPSKRVASKFKEKNVIEGIDSCKSICQLGKKYNVELPICNSVKFVLDGKDLSKVINDLLSRPLQFEN